MEAVFKLWHSPQVYPSRSQFFPTVKLVKAGQDWKAPKPIFTLSPMVTEARKVSSKAEPPMFFSLARLSKGKEVRELFFANASVSMVVSCEFGAKFI